MERERIQLSDPDAWVEVKKKWSWGDGKAFQKAQGSAENASEGAVAFSQELLSRLILDWSFRDQAGAAVERSVKNIEDYLGLEDAQAIILRCIELGGPKDAAAAAKAAARPNS